MLDEEKGIYTIGTVSELISEHPETLRVWERNGIIQPERVNNQRRYSNNDLKRLKFVKYLLDSKGLNIAGVKQVTDMYSCWYMRHCSGGAMKNSTMPINKSKPCWKLEGAFCFKANDKADMCSTCTVYQNCKDCDKIYE
ncbi:MerR family transcriptional regulator [Petroclostridium sp. X23]|uniref:MerR family transcriptional regulator n=1 Tax=Petroclostridium sp. X23 TaxID=3045146 RepID=UPI0024ACB903|nr:MerR family transcriptional regulator [Petroclostridium sp. X23]WHH58385.1 MerR family transcriptional regulator [Petroclostridium sp. X23]